MGCDDALRRVASLHPPLERPECVELIRTRAAAAMVDAGCEEQTGETLDVRDLGVLAARVSIGEERRDLLIVLERVQGRDEGVSPPVPQDQLAPGFAERPQIGTRVVEDVLPTFSSARRTARS